MAAFIKNSKTNQNTGEKSKRSVVLSIYSQRAFKEFVLPAATNIETVLSLRREIFELAEDIELKLENIDGNWRILEQNDLILTKSGQPYHQEILQNGDYFQGRIRKQRVLAIMVSISSQRFSGYQKYVLVNSNVKIGTMPECGICYSFEYGNAQYIGHNHAIIAKGGQGLTLTDNSRNGTFVNDLRIKGTVPLRFGDRINIWGLHIVALGEVLAIRPQDNLKLDLQQLQVGDVVEAQIANDEDVKGKIRYHRSPRNVGRILSGKVEIEAPPAPERNQDPPLYMSVGPALTMALPMIAGSGMAVIGASMGGMYMYAGIVTAVLSAIIGAVWAVVNVRYNQKQRKIGEQHRFSSYSDYLIRVTEEVRTKYEHNLQVMKDTYPPAAQCLEQGCRGQGLWERNVNHPDFLAYRLGQGDVPFQVEIQVPPERFEIIDDSLRDKPRMIRENFQTLHNVPVCVDLKQEHIVGLVGGPNLEGARALLDVLVSQIAVENSYTEVKLAFLYQQDQGDDDSHWSYCRWLPHVWSEDRKVRYVAANKAEASDVLFELASVLRMRGETEATAIGEQEMYKPWYIVVLENSAILENEPVAKYLLDTKRNLGVTTVLLANTPEDLPNVCECIIRNDEQFTGIYHAQESEAESGRLELDTVDRSKLERLARYLTNVGVSETEVGGDLPSSVTFFEMYGITRLQELQVEERWKKSRTYENMRAMLGFKNGGQPCYLDVHEKYHGPHGLVAGTTGSGKSETLQTWLLSLTINFSPYDVGLFIIDYKGGGMANLFAGLPHTLGIISNLSGGQVNRAMASIKSENMRRQRIFNDNDVNNINLYTNLFKNGEVTTPVPHLFIVIDEFAELKREQPEFMRELISVAQVGRSLGVHLILATQKPSGTVDDNIWSNSKFRICLRVQDRQDSMDMLHKADAAYLTQAGRGFLQVGSDEVYEQFQSGWSGAAYDEDADNAKQELAKLLTNTGKTAIVGNYLKRQLKEKKHRQWLEQLSDCLDTARKTQLAIDDKAICAEVYQICEERKIEYPRSNYNTGLLEHLLDLLRDAENMHLTGDERIGYVIQEAAERKIRLPEPREKTQLDAVVEYLAGIAKAENYQKLPTLWLPPLPNGQTDNEKGEPNWLYLDMLKPWAGNSFRNGQWPAQERRWELKALIGLNDSPATQSQSPVELNFTKNAHHALIGSAASGKSTFVQTLLYSLANNYSPEYVNFYVLDFSSQMSVPFRNAPHTGGILTENEVDQVGKLFFLLGRLVTERKKLFSGGNYQQYVMNHGQVCPAILVVVDGISKFREKTGEIYDDTLIRLAQEGANCGIYLLITAGGFGINEIQVRLSDQIPTALTLSLSDVFQYGDALRGPQPPVFPEADVPGRGLIDAEGTILEYQTALPVRAADDFERRDILEKFCTQLKKAWKGKPARPIPSIPAHPQLSDLLAREETAALLKDPRYLPIGFDDVTADVYSIDLSHTYCYTVSGRARTGKTNTLKLIMNMAAEKGCHVSVLENDGVSLRGEASKLGADYCTTREEIVKFVGELGNTFSKRNALKRDLLSEGMEQETVFVQMSREQPWIIVIADLVRFTQMIYELESMELNLHGALENLIGRGFLHNIYFVGGLDQDERAKVAGMNFFDLFVKDIQGIHLGGNVSGQSLFDFHTMPFQEQNAVEPAGVGLVPPYGSEPRYSRVILPQVKKR